MNNFDSIIGQDHIKEHLKKAIAIKQISHAYIISGERNSGKEFIARIFAQTLQCEAGKDEPCNTCRSCLQAVGNNHPDIKKITHEKPNVISVDDIRNQLVGDVLIKPYYGPWKIYIINEAEKMNDAAQNALLKTLEEPPAYAIIILLTVNEDSLLQTVRSRCVSISMKPVDNKQMRKYLVDSLHIPVYQADICMAFARGNVGRARNLAMSEDFDNIKDNAVSVLKYIKEMNTAELVEAVKNIMAYKVEIQDYLDILTVWYRDILLYKATGDLNDLTFKDERKYIKKQADESTYEGIGKVIEAIETAKSRLKANVNFELTMELLLLSIKEN